MAKDQGTEHKRVPIGSAVHKCWGHSGALTKGEGGPWLDVAQTEFVYPKSASDFPCGKLHFSLKENFLCVSAKTAQSVLLGPNEFRLRLTVT